MRFASFALLAAALVATGPPRGAETTTSRVSDVSGLASLLEGEFTTAPDPAAGPVPKEGPPPLYDLAKRVDVPKLGRDVVYAELREGSRDGKLLQQRLYVLTQDPDGSRIMMAAYDLGRMPELAGVYANPAPLARLELPGLDPREKDCEMAWHRGDNGFVGQAGKGNCPAASMAVSKEGLSQSTGPSAQATVFRRLR
ncbi:MAG TPA: CpcT/CpeT family chromophore lyase [Alphaproteobacteria bacterium]|nr:CpcT/CpeT family chromophore lyase [Alphaproteobacteria bacterium]